MLKIGDQVKVVWNQKGLPMEFANGHYPNEQEAVTILSEDEDFFYCTNTVEICKNAHTLQKDQFGGVVVFDKDGQVVVGFNNLKEALSEYPDSVITDKIHKW